MEMETKIIAIEIPTHTEIITISCFDGNGTFFAKSVGIIEALEEAMKESKEDTTDAKETVKETTKNLKEAKEALK